MVFIFARTADDSLASLAKQLDKVVEENKDKKLAAVINFIGDKDLGEAIKKFGEKHGIKNTALTVSDEKNAKRFQVTSDADVTVMHYKGKKVLSNQAVAKGGLNKKSIAAIIAGSKTILK